MIGLTHQLTRPVWLSHLSASGREKSGPDSRKSDHPMIPILYLFIVRIGVAFVREKMNNFAKTSFKHVSDVEFVDVHPFS